METLTIAVFLRGLAGVGSIGLAVWLLSLVGPHIPAFVALSSTMKKIVMFGLSTLIAIGAWALVKYVPDSFWLAVREPFAILMLIAGAIFGNQLVYRVGPKLNEVSDQADSNTTAIVDMPTSAELSTVVADVDRIRDAGMIVPQDVLVPHMTPKDALEALQRVKDKAAGNVG